MDNLAFIWDNKLLSGNALGIYAITLSDNWMLLDFHLAFIKPFKQKKKKKKGTSKTIRDWLLSWIRMVYDIKKWDIC